VEDTDARLLRLLWAEPGARARVVPRVDRGSGLAPLVLHATRREVAVAGWRLRAVASRRGRREATVWRRSAPHLRSSARDAVVRRLAAGAALLPADAVPSDLWRQILRASGVTGTGLPAVGMEGSLRVTGHSGAGAVVLRVGAVGSEADPTAAAQALEHLQRAGLDACPHLVGSGVTDGWAWSVEQRLPGTRPRRVDEPLLRDVAAWVERLASVPGLPASAASRTGVHGEALDLAALIPSEAARLDVLARRLVDRPVLRRTATAHGDLWSGNLLVHRGRLSGVVDWDACTSGAVPGTDLVHLVTTEERLRRRVPLGAVVSARPWHADPLRTLLERVVPGGADAPTRQDVGTAWWLHHVRRAVVRVPRLAEDRAWVDANVRQALDVLVDG
jgi:phosphotransferase family enzyme